MSLLHPKRDFTCYFLSNLMDPVYKELIFNSSPYPTGDVLFEKNFLVSLFEEDPLI
jgi:hypothetical protein